MKKKQRRLFIDQYGRTLYVYTIKELRQHVGGSVSKMYIDKNDGSVVHIGYVVGQYWFTEYQPVERKA